MGIQINRQIKLDQKYLILILFTLIAGNVINLSFQNFVYYHVFAQDNTEDNQPPEVDDQKVSVDANDNVKITLDGKDDDKGDDIEFDIVSDPSHGKFDNFDKSDGTVTYKPDNAYSGDDDFKFKVIDDKGAESDTAEVKINVKAIVQSNQEAEGAANQEAEGAANQELDNQTARADEQSNSVDTENQSPIAYDQSLSVDANDKVVIALVGNDADNDPIQFAIVSNPSDASLDNFDTAKGTVTYIPEPDYVGNDSFAFNVIDNKAVESNTATVNVDVKATVKELSVNDSAANQAPVALDQSTSVDKNNQLNITLVGNDADNDPIQFAIVSNPSDASLDNFDMAKGIVTYIPELNYVGNDSFAFKVTDDKAVESNIATVNVDVKDYNQTNQAPQAFDLSTNETNSSNYRYLTWSAGEEDDRYILFARSTDGGKTYSSPVSLSSNIRSTVFNPEVSSSGNNVYVVWQGLSITGNQDIFLRKSTDYGSSFGEIENISKDPGGSGNPQVEIVGNSTHVAWEGTTPGNNFIFYTTSDDGSAFESPQKLSSNLGISYKPEIIVKENPSSDSFTYKVTDENGAQSNVATVNVNVDTTDQSTLEDDVKSVSIASNQEIDITLKAKDKDNDTLLYDIVTPPSDGTLDNYDPSSGTVTYVPNENNEVDISWHNYINGHDRTMTKTVDSGDSDSASSVGVENDDPFKAKR